VCPPPGRDLIGSPHAYAALSRAARSHGDVARAAAADARCLAMAANPGICRGEYPVPPLLRGAPLGYALPGLVFAAAALLRLRRRRGPPWARFRAPIFAGLVILGGAGVLATARSPWKATTLAIVTLSVFLLQRRAFLSAVRRGKVDGFHLRPGEPADDGLPLVAGFFGPEAPETLERLPDASYRTAARGPLLRVGRRRVPHLWIIVAVVIAVLFAGCGSLMLLTMRKSETPHRIHESPETLGDPTKP
jgi:hypothetical protein